MAAPDIEESRSKRIKTSDRDSRRGDNEGFPSGNSERTQASNATVQDQEREEMTADASVSFTMRINVKECKDNKR